MKTFISSDLVHIALIVSLLRLFPELYNNPRWGSEPLVREVFLGASSAYTQTNFHNIHNGLDGYLNAKNVDNFLSRSLFTHDLRAYSRSARRSAQINSLQNNVIAYIVNSQQHHSVPLLTNGTSVSPEERQLNLSANSDPDAENSESDTGSSDLTQEDMDLIEILWKQDIDLGISREVFDGTWSSQEIQKANDKKQAKELEDGKNPECDLPSEPMVVPDPWQGLQYTIDSETGEHVIHNPPCPSEDLSPIQLPPEALQNISLEEALQLFEGDTYHLLPPVPYPSVCNTLNAVGLNENELAINDQRSLLEQLNELERLSLEARNDNSTAVGMETDWRLSSSLQPCPADLQLPQTSVGFSYELEPMNVSDSFHQNNSLSGVLLRNSTLPSVIPPTNFTSSVNDFQMQPVDDRQLVDDRQFMDFLAMLSNGSDPGAGTMDSTTSEQISDFFGANLTNGVSDYISQLLTDEGLDLMDLSGMQENADVNVPKDTVLRDQEVSDDSAVSCMSSESTHSDAEWVDSASDTDSECTNKSPRHRQLKKNTAARHFRLVRDGSLPSDPVSNSSNDCLDNVHPSRRNNSGRLPSSHAPTPDSDSESLFHNHTYHLPPTEGTPPPKPTVRDKRTQEQIHQEQLNRDERRARALKIPFPNSEIVNLSIEEFNELLLKYDLSEAQLTLVRDIRRRGKNKVAAQNCRKRKLNQIVELQMELDDMQSEKVDLELEHEEMISHHELLKEKYDRLHQFLFQSPGPPDPHGFNSQMTERENQRSTFHGVANSTNQDGKDLKCGARTKRKQDRK